MKMMINLTEEQLNQLLRWSVYNEIDEIKFTKSVYIEVDAEIKYQKTEILIQSKMNTD